ncbi:grasp-with-spasm system SPASM domain peptide maturase [Flavobacterium sp. ZS1P14]|uniref:grasp-with-spasm system SPASM domain peptide maturase n=1 Tax=Flavobacterium sp. ZS1P14 TaxID=3401729 RepID=UPI003AAC2E7B
MIDKKFKLFSNCFSVKGINRALILDLQRKNYYILPNQIIDFINEYSGKKVYDLFRDFKNDKTILKKYIRYFLKNELVIIDNDLNLYPAISNNFDRPYRIDTITLDLNLPILTLKEFLEINVDNLGVSCLKLISDNFNLKKIVDTLHFVDKSKIKTIVIFIKYRDGLETELINLKKTFFRITEIIFYDVDITNDSEVKKFIYEKKSLSEVLSMTIYNHDDFVLSFENFNESLSFNTAYNRTIFIDLNGDIKRHIEDQSVFGNIDIADLNEVVDNEEVKKFWAISKDKILICKDCEFRYICPDGSIPFKEKETDIFYSTKTKCNYDPYKNLWNNA